MDDRFTLAEIDLFRQWFNAVEDTGGEYLEVADYDLADKLADMTGTPRPNRQRRRCWRWNSTVGRPPKEL